MSEPSVTVVIKVTIVGEQGAAARSRGAAAATILLRASHNVPGYFGATATVEEQK